jgi:periplasmic copper chaperone A
MAQLDEKNSANSSAKSAPRKRGAGLPALTLAGKAHRARSYSVTNLVGSSIRGGLVGVFALSAVQLLAANAQAADYDVGAIHIAQPWARATPKGASAGAGYMTITNNGTAADRVTCVSSDVSAKCQIHTMSAEGGVMKMRPVEGGLEIKPGETVTLKPGGSHVMLVGLKHPLEQGNAVKTTLKFEQAGTVDVEYPIAAIGAAAPGVPAGGGTMMMEGHGGMMQMQKH